MAVRLSAILAGRSLPQGKFLVLISVTGCVDPRAIVRLEGLGQLRKSNDFIGTRTRDLPIWSIVPQPTTLPRSPNILDSRANINLERKTLSHGISYYYNVLMFFQKCNGTNIAIIHQSF
jgi:hypothetical protein